MAIIITVVATLGIIGIISAFFLIRPNPTRGYARKIEKDYREQDIEPAARVAPPPRVPRTNNAGGDNSLTPLLINVLRAVIGLAAVGVLAAVYNSTTAAAGAAGADLSAVYSEGIFKAVITIGIALALYIFTRFQK
jgi:hypothetical protein